MIYTLSMKFIIILSSLLMVGCATSQTSTHSGNVAWPNSCGPEPQFFKSFTFDNHRREIIYDLCERTEPGNYRTARSAARQAARYDRQVSRNIRSMGTR